ncbi:MAG: carbonic anhydrase, partial [Firmicutes bacterium]|nr:carbonic anhydrase [Bacillota bacterium]
GYAEGKASEGDISAARRTLTTNEGQHPYAVVITCSDSRVPAEHIFGAGIGDLFVIRTAGNLMGALELGSVEYGAEHLGAKVIMMLAHSNCGAVAAALSEGHAHGHIADVVEEVRKGIGDEKDASRAEYLNAKRSVEIIRASELVAPLLESGAAILVQAKYDISTGLVSIE